MNFMTPEQQINDSSDDVVRAHKGALDGVGYSTLKQTAYRVIGISATRDEATAVADTAEMKLRVLGVTVHVDR